MFSLSIIFIQVSWKKNMPFVFQLTLNNCKFLAIYSHYFEEKILQSYFRMIGCLFQIIFQ